MPNDWDDDGVSGSDAFPFDAREQADSDDDGVGDNTDAFPDDPSESVDSDGDGVGDGDGGEACGLCDSCVGCWGGERTRGAHEGGGTNSVV